MILLAMAAIVLAGVAGCTGGELVEEQHENGKTVTLTTKVSMDASTKALTPTGVKTFAAGETMAVIYNNGTSTVKAVSHALKDGDLIDGGKSATFTFDLETPNVSVDVTYIYPAAMAGNTGVDDGKLNLQDGTLASISSNLDLATQTAAWEGTSLPAVTLENELAILAITLLDSGGSNGLGNITSMTVSDGTNTYTVTPQAPATELTVPVYVAIRPTSDATITVTALTEGTKRYSKILTGKTYAASNGYDISWRMEAWESNEYKEGAWDGSKVVFKKNTATNPTVLTSSDSDVNLAEEWYTVIGDVVINGQVNFTGETHLILCDGAKLTVNGRINVDGYSYIYGQGAGNGKLIVTSGDDNSILGNSSLYIHGGDISATSSISYALCLNSKFYMYGGNLTATTTDENCIYGPDNASISLYGGIIKALNDSRNDYTIHLNNHNHTKLLTVYGGKLSVSNRNSSGGAIYGYVRSGKNNIKFYWADTEGVWDSGHYYGGAYNVQSSPPYAKAE